MNETEDNEATCKPHNVEEKGTEDSLPAASGELLAFLSLSETWFHAEGGNGVRVTFPVTWLSQPTLSAQLCGSEMV